MRCTPTVLLAILGLAAALTSLSSACERVPFTPITRPSSTAVSPTSAPLEVVTVEPTKMPEIHRLEGLASEVAGPDQAFIAELLTSDWVRDSLETGEVEPITQWESLITADLEVGSSVARTLWTYHWARDDMTQDETRLVAKFVELVRTADTHHVDALATVASYEWVQREITRDKIILVRRNRQFFNRVGPEHAEALVTILNYEWIRDGISVGEARPVGHLLTVLSPDSQVPPASITTYVSYPWLADSISRDEIDLSWQLRDFLLEQGAATSTRLRDAHHTVLGYDWMRDGLTGGELYSFHGIRAIFRFHNPDTADFIDALVSRPWMKDDINSNEADLLWGYFNHLDVGQESGAIVPPDLDTLP